MFLSFVCSIFILIFVFILFLVKLITLFNGNKVLMCNNYTYSKSGAIWSNNIRRWACSQRHAGCKAFIRAFDEDYMKIIRMNTNHNHKPHNYMQLKDGKYLKIRDEKRLDRF